MALESKLIEPLIVEAAESRRQATEGPDKSELRGDNVNDQPEARSLRKRKAVLGFGLHLGKGIPYCQKVRNQLVAALSSKCKIADPVGSIEGATYQIATLQGMFRPWHDDV